MFLKTILIFLSLTSCLRKQISLTDLKKAFIDQSFKNFEKMLDPVVYVVAEKDQCMAIFNNALGNKQVGILKKNHQGQLTLDEGLTSLYNSRVNIDRREIVAVMSPYARTSELENFTIYRFEKPFSSGGDKKILAIQQAIYKNLQGQQKSNYIDEIIQFTQEKLKSGILYRFYLETCDPVLETIGDTNHPLKKELEVLKATIVKWNLSHSNFIDRTTNELINILQKYNVFSEAPNLAKYPDLVPLIFPFKICNLGAFNRYDQRQFTIGFDLRSIAGSELKFLFNMKEVEKLNKENGVWYMTFITS